ncbi:MAG: hypothetical protein L3K06_08680, partial [Thermoplasmata archaeon]|nr:hypothetical protein [Thermoplasmata archaeon]
MDRLLIVSADDHVGGRPADYRDYLEAPYRDRVDDLVEEDAEYARLGRFVNQFPEHFDDIVD